jgi:hypothetical protein
VFLLLSIFSCTLVAQQNYGKILGTVTDPAGAVITGAKVTVSNADTHVSNNTETDKDGFYQVLSLPIGNYIVAVDKAGFKKEVTEPRALLINQNLRVDLKLQIGSNTETVSVESQNAGVETVSSTLGHSVTGENIQLAPLNGRNTLDLALLEPGVTETNGGNAGAGNYQIFGGKSDSVTFLLDGGVNNNLLSNGVVYNPNPDTIAEFRLISSNYSAEYGRNNGGIISVVTKSGTNTLHGSLYDYIRNDALNANTFFNKRSTPVPAPRNILKRHQFGGTAGGPIELPHYSGKNKFFWFFGYQGQRQTSTSAGTKTTVFTPAELNGDFSASAAKDRDNVACFLTGLPQPTNPCVDSQKHPLPQHPFFQPNAAKAALGIIDPTKIDPIAQNYIKNNLIPTDPTGVLIPRGLSTDNNDEFTGKFDFLATDKDRFSVTLGKLDRNNLNALGSGLPQYPTLLNQQRRYMNLGYTRTFSPNLLNEFRATANRAVSNQAFRGAKLPDPTQLGIGITPDALTGPTRLSLASMGAVIGFSNQGPTTIVDDDFSFSDNLTWTKGRHTMKFGWQLIPYDDNQLFDFFIDGEFDFNGASGIGTKNDRADLLLGLPDAFLQFPAAPSNIRTKASYYYAQDDWRVLPNLTFNLGLRYEYSTPKSDTQGRTFTSILTNAKSQRFVNAPAGLFFPGDPQAPRGSNFSDKNDFAPRFGFAWDPFNDGKTSVRGGVGVFYDVLKAEDNFQFNGQAPFFASTSLTFNLPAGNPSANYTIMSQPFPAAGQTNPFPSKPPTSTVDFSQFGSFGGAGVFFVDPHLRTPYTFQYNLSVQHELPQGILAEVGYVGSQTRKETALIDDNPFTLGTYQRIYDTLPGNFTTPVTGDGTATIASKLSGCRGTCGFSYLDTFHNVVNANYSGLETSLTKRSRGDGMFARSFFTLSYSWEKSIDNSSGFRNNSSRVPFYNHNLFRAVSAYDVANRFSASGGWELPFDKACEHCSNRLTRGWIVYPIFTWRTGFPLDISAGLSRQRQRPGPSGAGDANQVRANFTGTSVPTIDPHHDSTFKLPSGTTVSGVYWFDPTLFSTSATGLFADAGVSPTRPTPDPVNNPADRTYGTLGRDRFFGPGRTNLDFAIGKTTAIWGENRVTLTIRAEMFNVLNHTEFSPPSTNINSAATFGQISSTFDPRIIQISGRIQF